MIGRLNHVAIAVPDLQAASEQYRTALGAKVGAPQDEPDHGVTVVFIELPNTKIELLEPREDASIALESPEQAFDLIAALVHGPVVFPRVKAFTGRGHDRNEPQVQSKLAGFVAFVCTVHEQMNGPACRPQAL